MCKEVVVKVEEGKLTLTDYNSAASNLRLT